MFQRRLPLRPQLPLNRAPTRRHAHNDGARTRLDRVIQRMPRFMQKYTTKLRNAPVSHAVSFLILHEITAVAPLVGLSYYFHVTNWLPVEWSEGSYIASYVERYDRYFRRKGWFGLSDERDDELSNKITPEKSEANVGPSHTILGGETHENALTNVPGGSRAWAFTSDGTRVVVEVATAYAITKALMPLRLMVSLWLTPWFARVSVTKVTGMLRAIGKQISKTSGPRKP